MTRYVLSFLFFLFFFFLETSFLTSLPFIFPLTPLVFGVSVYLLQHQGLMDGFFWILLYGTFLQWLHMETTPFPVVAYALAGVVCLLSARHLFSNRSLYGVAACALLGYLTSLFSQSLFLFGRFLTTPIEFSWHALFSLHVSRILLLLLVLLVFYSFAKPIQFFLFRK